MFKRKQVENKKILNAKPKEYNGIQFKSLLEVSVFKALTEAGLNPKYESEKIIIFEGFKPKSFFFTRGESGLLEEDFKKIMDITYTPDIVLDYNGIKIYIEVKGFENDVFPIKKKLFRKWIESQKDSQIIYFEVWSKKQTLQAIDIIKNHSKYMNKIEEIRQRLGCLPTKKDQTLGEAFLNKRDFVSLDELVLSDVYKARVQFEKVCELEGRNNPTKESIDTDTVKENLLNLQELYDLIHPIALDFTKPLVNRDEEDIQQEQSYQVNDELDENNYC